MIPLRPCLLTKSISERPCMRSYPAKSAGFSPRAVKANIILEFSVDLLLSSCPCSFIFSLTYFSTLYKYASSASSDRPVPERARPITTHSPPTESTKGEVSSVISLRYLPVFSYLSSTLSPPHPDSKNSIKAISTMILPESLTLSFILHLCVSVAPSSFYYTNILLLARGCCQWKSLIFH